MDCFDLYREASDDLARVFEQRGEIQRAERLRGVTDVICTIFGKGHPRVPVSPQDYEEGIMLGVAVMGEGLGEFK